MQGDKDAEGKHIREIGNFLYNFRPDWHQEGGNKLNKNEVRLLRLACRLTENAFYDGKLESLSQEQAAALAFTLNVTTKLANQNKDAADWFDREKFKNFISEVETFEQGKAYSKFSAEEAIKYDEAFQNAKQAVMGRIRNPDIVPYFIKTCLIADAMLKNDWTEETRPEGVRLLTQIDPHSPYRAKEAGRLPTYNLLGEAEYSRQGKRSAGRISYANLHYMPEKMPVAVWALEYLNSKKANI